MAVGIILFLLMVGCTCLFIVCCIYSQIKNGGRRLRGPLHGGNLIILPQSHTNVVSMTVNNTTPAPAPPAPAQSVYPPAAERTSAYPQAVLPNSQSPSVPKAYPKQASYPKNPPPPAYPSQNPSAPYPSQVPPSY